MNNRDQLPSETYKMYRFRDPNLTKCYISILIGIYEENLSGYHQTIGVADSICIAIIRQVLDSENIDRMQEEDDDNATDSSEDRLISYGLPGRYLKNLVNWKWLREDYDATDNISYYTFPVYSQKLVNAYRNIWNHDSEAEKKGIMSVYSNFNTYLTQLMSRTADKQFLDNAYSNTLDLIQILANTEDDMREFYNMVSRVDSLHETADVLIEEMKSVANQRYRFLMESTSFYKYKNQVTKDIDTATDTLIDIIRDLEKIKEPTGTQKRLLNEYIAQKNAVYELENEFVRLERQISKLAKAKELLEKKAGAKIRYWIWGGLNGTDKMAELLKRIVSADSADELIDEINSKICLSTPTRNLVPETIKLNKTEKIEYEREKVVQASNRPEGNKFSRFSNKALKEFEQKNTKNGYFHANSETIKNEDDIEKLIHLLAKMSVRNDIQIKTGATAEVDNWVFDEFSYKTSTSKQQNS